MKKQRMILRLDDASARMDVEKWQRMEELLDKYNIKPLVGVIPDCKDPTMVKYDSDPFFWDKVHRWRKKGWIIAMHGYQHLYLSNEGGINPVNKKSEFAGLSYEKQAEKMQNAWDIFIAHGITPNVFFAPSHTFDKDTLKALKNTTPIRIVSDTVAYDVYNDNGIIYLPLQCGEVRNLPFMTVTYCYHPNNMNDTSFDKLDIFLNSYSTRFHFDEFNSCDRKLSYFDLLLRDLYFFIRKLRKIKHRNI